MFDFRTARDMRCSSDLSWFRRNLVPLFLCVLFLASGSLWAQTSAEVTGVITDPSGAVVPGATVTVTNTGTTAARVVQSNSAGIYDVPALIPGTYSVEVKKGGFRTVVRTGIVLQVQQVARIDFTVQVGQVTQTLQVTANAAQLNTENSTVGNVVEHQRIVDLPLNGRDILQLTALQANVSYGFGANGTASSRVGGLRAAQTNISIAGGRAEFNYYTLDGVSDTDVSYNTYTFLPSIDALQEFKVQTGVYPAEFGRGLSQVNIATRSGTNQLHGALFEFLRNSSVDAIDYCFTVPCVPANQLHQNQYGFVVGGPVVIPKVFNGKDKLFFMANWEGFRYSQGVSENGTVPTLNERAGNFTGLNPIYDPTTRVMQPDGTVTATQFPMNQITTIDPVAQKLLNYIPLPLPNTGIKNNYSTILASTENNDQETFRIDFNQSTKSSWFGRYSKSNERSVTPNGVVIDENTRLESHPKQFVLSNVRTFGSTVVNQVWLGYNRLNNEILNWNSGNAANNVVGQIGGIPGVAAPYPLIYGLPSLGISGLSSFGDNGTIPFILIHNTFQGRDVLSLVRGKHSIDLGAEIRYDQDTTEGNSFIRGAFSFDGTASRDPSAPAGTTGVPFADFLLGKPELFDSALALAQSQLRGYSQSYFMQDSWKVIPKLTITAGLRYDYYQPWTEKHDHIVNILFPAPYSTNQPIMIMPGSGNFYDNLPVPFTFGGGLQAIRSNWMGPATYYTSKNDFQPRFGIAYSPTSKWVIRTGFGMFDVQGMQDINFDPARTLAARRQIATNAAFPDLTFEQPIPGGGSSFQVTQPYSYAADAYMHTPYFYQYIFDVQRQVTPNLMVDVGYLGSAGHHLPSLIEYNTPLPGPGSVSARRPFPSFGPIQTNAAYVNSNYNSLAVRVEKRLSHGLNFVESYTWSKSIDDLSAVRDHSGDTLFPQNNYDPMADRGLSNFNTGQRSATSILWDLPVGKGRKWLGSSGGLANGVVGGWEVAGIITFRSGFPYNMNSGSDPANVGLSGYQRPDYTGLPVSVPNPGPNGWFNLNAFTTPNCYCYGSVGRNTLIGPGYSDFDLSLMKNFVIREGKYFQFRFEGFNAMNHPNWGEPNTRLTSPGVTTITDLSGSMRILQFGLKFYF